MAEELILLSSEYSLFAERVKIAFAEKGITNYQVRNEDLSNKSPLLLQMNPVHKLVPVLIHNGKPICESMIIVQYIDDFWNHKSPLLPSDPYQRAHARFWADYIDKKIYPIGRMLWRSKGEIMEASRKDLIQSLKTLNSELGEKAYFNGESFGYIDLALIPFYNVFYTFESLGNFSMEVECPQLVEWAKRCSQKETVSKSIWDKRKFYEMSLRFKAKLSLE
ncbi:hypothetical protein P3X46_001373 [Hevea brasiliensis]|uniref:glutathione transferase n=1 Tax=Hevea brasiliensis TaxID=3981 RepID=A0ABQ9NE67_HEVBR|nr:probable glutathione S-transferase parC [Hevea brasiliensis]KAJ9190145.1 hypothetical protein P3X46_001373 [Hevea brasiliensis]